MRDNAVLEKFGRIAMTEVRDEAISKFEMILSGKMKSDSAIMLHEKLSGFSDADRDIIKHTLVSSIDDVIHNFLWMFEQHEDDLKLLCRNDGKADWTDVEESSDGLAGELYTEDGWIAKFSQFR